MEIRKVVGQVTPEERDEIQKLFERKNGLAELAKIVSADNNELYEKLVKDMGETGTKFQKWWGSKRSMMTAQLLFIGTTELMLIAGIALLLFGGKKLPEMMRGMGRGISEFKKGAKEISEPFEEVKKDIDEVIKE